MSVFSHIEGKPLEKVSFDELRSFLDELVFFRFMEEGKNGITSGAWIIVANVHAWQVKVNFFGKEKDQHQLDEVAKIITRQLMNDVTSRGTKYFGESVCSAASLLENL